MLYSFSPLQKLSPICLRWSLSVSVGIQCCWFVSKNLWCLYCDFWVVTHTDTCEVEAQTLGIFVHESHHFCNIFHSKSNHCVFILFYTHTHTHTPPAFFICTGQPTIKYTAQLRKLLKAQERADTFCDLFKLCSSDSLTDQFGFYGNTYVWGCWIMSLVLLFSITVAKYFVV